MASTSCVLALFLLTTLISILYGQSVSVGQNAFDSLDALGCTKFKAIIMEAGLENTYRSSQTLTLFVFSDTTFAEMDPSRQGTLYGKSALGAQEYVRSFTVNEAIETTSFSDRAPYDTDSVQNRKLFLNSNVLRSGNVASGLPGPTRYFCNGAMITRPNIQAGQHVIHIIDQVLVMPYERNALAYVSGYNPEAKTYLFYTYMMEFLQRAPRDDGEYNYNKQVQEVLKGSQVTFFIPSDEAINQIPSQKLQELQGNTRLMLDIITLHIIPGQVLYTSLVNHNERFNTQSNSGGVVFRENFYPESTYVSGALRAGKTVTARINPANTTVLNSVVHQIDAILGFVYKTVIEEISTDPVTHLNANMKDLSLSLVVTNSESNKTAYFVFTSNFEQLIRSSRRDLQNYMGAANGVTVFVPSNSAMYAIANVYPNYINNQTLINMVLEMSLLQQGQRITLTDYNGGYYSYVTSVSRYNGRRIKVYSAGNDTWVEGGYVRARIIKPDIGCTNGWVHQIDAVFGIPTRDIPYTIFCENRLKSTFRQLQYVGLDKYMKDPTLIKNQECRTNTVGGDGSMPNNPSSSNNDNNYYSNSRFGDLYNGLCGDGTQRCEFTFFVPNGTAIDNFARTPYGRHVMNDPVRWRWILRRLITRKEKIYFDQIQYGAPRSFYADNGEEVLIQTDSRSNIPSGQRTAWLLFDGVRAEIIHQDIGATNGVIHIINTLLFVPEDLERDVSGHFRCLCR